LSDGWKIVALDISQEALHLAHRVRDDGNLILANASRLPLQEESFDAVFSFHVTGHLRAAACSLAFGGRLFFIHTKRNLNRCEILSGLYTPIMRRANFKYQIDRNRVDNMQEVIKREEKVLSRRDHKSSHEDDRTVVLNLMLASMQTIAPLVEREADNVYTVADLKIRFR
jgi:hypothetical protein